MGRAMCASRAEKRHCAFELNIKLDLQNYNEILLIFDLGEQSEIWASTLYSFHDRGKPRTELKDCSYQNRTDL
jgi:hypothetical protein